LDRLRALAAEKVRTTELTALSADLCRVDYLGSRSLGGGMSPAEVKRFLFGYDPDGRTKHPLPVTSDLPAPDEHRGETVVLGVLVRDLPPERRPAAIVTLLGTIASFYKSAGVSLPAWLTDAALMTWTNDCVSR
jgi:hypothetical protein